MLYSVYSRFFLDILLIYVLLTSDANSEPMDNHWAPGWALSASELCHNGLMPGSAGLSLCQRLSPVTFSKMVVGLGWSLVFGYQEIVASLLFTTHNVGLLRH